LEELVPIHSFYRRLEAALDLSFVRDLVRSLYAGGGRPSVDPVVFFKLQLVLFFEGVEPFFAEAKDRHGMRRFRLRRLEKVNAEALLIAAGQNVKRLLTFGARRPRKIAQAAALRSPRRPPSQATLISRTSFGR
jgi:hypothetical protein